MFILLLETGSERPRGVVVSVAGHETSDYYNVGSLCLNEVLCFTSSLRKLLFRYNPSMR